MEPSETRQPAPPDRPLPDRVEVGQKGLTDVPARLDRLPWSGWHLRIVIALGITWILDGLEVTLVGSVASVLGETDTLHLSGREIGLAGSAYLAGAILGALLFGRLTDKLGRKKLFLVTLAVYLVSTMATALAIGPLTFALFRGLTGAGIGGEYAAINSAIDELLPARIRGRADLAINATYWFGTALGALATVVLLDPRIVSHAIGWRLAFGLGGVLGLSVLVLRNHVPESRAGCSSTAASATRARSSRRSRPRWRSPPASSSLRPSRPRSSRRTDRSAGASSPGPCSWATPSARSSASPHGGAGLRLQRHLLHLCARPHQLLPGAQRKCRFVHTAFRRGEPPRAAGAGAPLRHHRPAG